MTDGQAGHETRPPDQRPGSTSIPVASPAQSATAPVAPTHHGVVLRGLGAPSASATEQGRFGRMFRHLPVFDHEPAPLTALAASMIAAADPKDTAPVPQPPPDDDDENPNIPAGYTYLGQFVDHDITFDPTSSLQRQNDPDALHDFRTPRFDLDSLYGRGPADQPYLYLQDPRPLRHPELGFDQRGVMFLLGRDLATPADAAHVAFAGPDLPRNSQGRALVGDPRNDENLIVSQLQVAFLRFHNRMVETTNRETGLIGDDLFKETQRRVRWHYQWVVVHDFLPRIVDGDLGDGARAATGVVADILAARSYVVAGAGGEQVSICRPRLLFYQPRRQPYLPVEFSAAAYRYGHSMIRPSYFFNDFVKNHTGNARTPIFSADPNPLANLNGFRPLPDNWGFQWKYFFDLEPGGTAQRSYEIDSKLVHPLESLPPTVAENPANLAHRNLLRGLRLGLPSGQSVARAMGITPLSAADLGLDQIAAEYAHDAPLWFYLLKEAELLGNSRQLGPAGGRIVAEVLIGLLAGDPLSYLSVAPAWTPELAEGGRFGMPELLRFALGA